MSWIVVHTQLVRVAEVLTRPVRIVPNRIPDVHRLSAAEERQFLGDHFGLRTIVEEAGIEGVVNDWIGIGIALNPNVEPLQRCTFGRPYGSGCGTAVFVQDKSGGLGWRLLNDDRERRGAIALVTPLRALRCQPIRGIAPRHDLHGESPLLIHNLFIVDPNWAVLHVGFEPSFWNWVAQHIEDNPLDGDQRNDEGRLLTRGVEGAQRQIRQTRVGRVVLGFELRDLDKDLIAGRLNEETTFLVGVTQPLFAVYDQCNCSADNRVTAFEYQPASRPIAPINTVPFRRVGEEAFKRGCIRNFGCQVRRDFSCDRIGHRIGGHLFARILERVSVVHSGDVFPLLGVGLGLYRWPRLVTAAVDAKLNSHDEENEMPEGTMIHRYTIGVV